MVPQKRSLFSRCEHFPVFPNTWNCRCGGVFPSCNLLLKNTGRKIALLFPSQDRKEKGIKHFCLWIRKLTAVKFFSLSLSAALYSGVTILQKSPLLKKRDPQSKGKYGKNNNNKLYSTTHKEILYCILCQEKNHTNPQLVVNSFKSHLRSEITSYWLKLNRS